MHLDLRELLLGHLKLFDLLVGEVLDLGAKIQGEFGRGLRGVILLLGITAAQRLPNVGAEARVQVLKDRVLLLGIILGGRGPHIAVGRHHLRSSSSSSCRRTAILAGLLPVINCHIRTCERILSVSPRPESVYAASSVASPLS